MQDFRPTLLHHMLALAPFDGWSRHMLCEAARRAGISESEATRAFPRGAESCIDYFFAQQDVALTTQFPEGSLSSLRVPQRIETLIMARLAALAPHREAVRRAASLRLLPWNAPHAVKSLAHTADLLWRLAGDRATDFNYYTKRMTLAGVYLATFTYWMNDQSEHLATTREFLKKRLMSVAEFGKKKKALKEKLQAFSYYKKRA